LVSKSQLKLITSLQQKKYRDKTGLFIAEGPKVIAEFITSGLRLHSLFASEEIGLSVFSEAVSEKELQKLSCLKTANKALAVFEIPKKTMPTSEGLIVALDAVRDPGNLGTIIRLCDWFGITQLVCSMDTADCYNPKVVQATMGSIARVHVEYVDLSEFLETSGLPIYGGVMNGSSIYDESLPQDAIIVLGNEANGISEDIQKKITHHVTIPQFGKIKETESLNVATATAILLSEFKRSTEK